MLMIGDILGYHGFLLVHKLLKIRQNLATIFLEVSIVIRQHRELRSRSCKRHGNEFASGIQVVGVDTIVA